MSKYIYLLKMSCKFNKIRFYLTPEITESLNFIGDNIMELHEKDLTTFSYNL